MPWNDNANPGPWGTPKNEDDPPRRPEGRRDEPGGGRRRPPPPGPGDPPPWMRDLNDWLNRLFGGGGGGGVRPGVFAVAGGVILLLWALSGVYLIQANEVGVITRFGAYAYTVEPGLHYRFPAPIENVIAVQTTNLRRLNVGGNDASGQLQESLMISSDESVVDLDFTVQWRVDDPVKYLFNVQRQEDTIHDVAETAMREVIGRTPSDRIVTQSRGEVQTRTAETMQRLLDNYDSGVRVVEVQINNANPPAPVVPAYRSLAQANQEAERLRNQGRTYQNRVINEAQGDASRITLAAEGYRQQVILIAQGQASRFDQLYVQYRLNPTVTRQRMYIETMERILSRVNKVVVDARGATAPIILPPDVFRPRAPAAPAQAPPQAQTQGNNQ